MLSLSLSTKSQALLVSGRTKYSDKTSNDICVFSVFFCFFPPHIFSTYDFPFRLRLFFEIFSCSVIALFCGSRSLSLFLSLTHTHTDTHTLSIYLSLERFTPGPPKIARTNNCGAEATSKEESYPHTRMSVSFTPS